VRNFKQGKKRQAELFKIVKDNIGKIDQLKLASNSDIVNLLNEEHKTNFTTKEYLSIRKSLEEITLECVRARKNDDFAITTISIIVGIISSMAFVFNSPFPNIIIFLVVCLVMAKGVEWLVLKNFKERVCPRIEKMVLNDCVMDFVNSPSWAEGKDKLTIMID
jgi:hypothetical protein